MKAKCPKCGSVEVDNYGVRNTAKAVNELEFTAIMVCCMKCGQFYEISVMEMDYK